jgi:hypothetical protein
VSIPFLSNAILMLRTLYMNKKYSPQSQQNLSDYGLWPIGILFQLSSERGQFLQPFCPVLILDIVR